MPTYSAPLSDWQFLLHDVLKIQEQALPGFTELDAAFTAPLLQAAARFHESLLHPMNLAADREGARCEAGRVSTPWGFVEAWQQYREAGWHRLSVASDLGGYGLPPVLAVPITELRAATGHSFSMYSAFCAPAATMLAALAPEWIKAHVVPRLVAGDWTATMCMTEPQAGTDLRQLTTRAILQPDGSWALHGVKIFISGGDHDLTDNIIHLVLAKIVDPATPGGERAGLEAVGVFMVPKRHIDPGTGAPGAPNGVAVRGLEHKMGIEGSATCELQFDHAIGWQILDEKQGGTAANMAPMFLLMNYARVGTAMSGVAYADLARQNAAAHARERRSGRSGRAALGDGEVADPIVAHADVRRLLLESRAFTEGARAGALQAALWQSEATLAADAECRQRAGDLLDVLTPVMKAFFTDRGFEATVACQQVYGGHGYIKDHGIEQWVRNARIGQLYEGANGVQAMDLIQRKLAAREGRAGQALLELFHETAQQSQKDPALATLVRPWGDAVARLDQSLQHLRSRFGHRSQQAAAGAYDWLTAIGIMYVGWNWLRMIAALPSAGDGADDDFARTKRALAQVWMQRQVPCVWALCERAEGGNDGLLAIEDHLI